jgi:hypothetical protein
MSQSGDTPYYRFDQKLGDPNDPFTPAAQAHPETRRPEIPAIFVANVDGETLISTLRGKRAVAWHAEPGTPCVILGYWADGTVKLRWPAIAGAYRVEGRFPAWVVEEDPDARMAGGGHILRANDPEKLGTPLLERAHAFLSRLIGGSSE